MKAEQEAAAANGTAPVSVKRRQAESDFPPAAAPPLNDTELVQPGRILPFNYVKEYYQPWKVLTDPNVVTKESTYFNIIPHTGETYIGKIPNPISVDTMVQLMSINESESLSMSHII